MTSCTSVGGCDRTDCGAFVHVSPANVVDCVDDDEESSDDAGVASDVAAIVELDESRPCCCLCTCKSFSLNMRDDVGPPEPEQLEAIPTHCQSPHTL